MRTLSAGILALVGAAFLIMTATPGTAWVGEVDAAAANVIESPTPPVNPTPIRPDPWPVEMPNVQPGSAWPIFGALRQQTVDVTPQEILPEPGAEPIVDVLPVYEIV